MAVVIETGRPVAEVARGLEVGEGTLRNWVAAWRRAHPEPETPPGPAGRARLAELEEEVSRPPIIPDPNVGPTRRSQPHIGSDTVHDLAVDDLAGGLRSYEAEPGVQQPQAHLWTGTAPAWTGRSSQL